MTVNSYKFFFHFVIQYIVCNLEYVLSVNLKKGLKKMKNLLSLVLFVSFAFVSCAEKEVIEEPKMSDEHTMVLQRIEAYAPVTLQTDLSGLSERERALVAKLVEAGKIIDEIFWEQSAHDAIKTRDSLMALNTDEAKDFLKYVMINYGPYDPLYDNDRFVGSGAAKRPQGGGFYPEDMTKEEFEAFIAANPDQAEAFKSQYTIIVRENGTLKAVPYHQKYAKTERLASLLEEAAELADNASLKKYLQLRATATRTDDYYESDLAWMELEGNNVDVVIGPIENYQDELFNYKTAHEAVVLVKDFEASAELDLYKSNMQNFENSLPIENKFKQKSIGDGNVIQVVNVVYFGGDCNQGVKTIAAALPNDPKVAEAKGRKLSMYKNHMEAKFDKIVAEIGKTLLTAERNKYVDKKAFTSFVTLHEVSHALGPKYVSGKKKMEIRNALKERYSAIEECKADALSMYNHKYLLESGIKDQEYIEKAKATYLAGLYRSIRFGSGAHYNANLIQLNFLKEQGVIFTTADGKLDLNDDLFFEKMGELSNLILMTQVNGDYDKAGEILAKYAVLTDDLKKEIEILKAIPRDIATEYIY